MDWKDVYQLPLRKDEHGHYAFSKNGTMAITFNFNINDMKFMEKFVSIVNGEKENEKTAGQWRADGVDIYCNDVPVCCVRGWGYLTGTGGLHLPTEEAIKIQDGFVNYILGRLNNRKA